MNAAQSMRVAARFAWRELRGGLRSFRVFLACLALGVAGLAAVGSVVAAIQSGLQTEGRAFLGGDVSVTLTYRFADEAERAALSQLGPVSEVVDLRASVTAVDSGDGLSTALVQAKAVDEAYPLIGALELTASLEPDAPAQPIDRAAVFGLNADGVPGAAAQLGVFTELGLEIGDRVALGDGIFELRAVIVTEPDFLAAGFRFGPRFMISRDALEQTGFTRPGTLFETQYRVLAPDADLAAARAELTTQFEDRGWRWRDRRNGTPGVERVVGQIGAFLTLVGLAALAVGGVGVGASVRSYLEGKTETIATLKTLGADGRTVLWTYLIQIGALTALGVAAGLALGALAPVLLSDVLAARLPVPANFGFYPEPLLEAALYGTLVAFLFALWPLTRAQEVRAAGLFRDLVAPARVWPRARALGAMALLGLGLAGAAALLTGRPVLAIAFILALAVALLFLVVSAQLVAWIARKLARSRLTRGRVPLRLALANVGGGEGGETRGAVLALGLGLTVLTAIGLIDVNLRRVVTDQLPKTAPEYFFVDIQNADLEEFQALASNLEGVTRVDTAPMLRGVITRINGFTPREWAAQGHVDEGSAWVLQGDRGVTYSATPPAGSVITDGAWWPEDYAGDALVSFAEEEALGLGIGVGDRLTVNVFGRDIEVEIANLRVVEFRDGGINFLMVMTPGVLAGAPHAHIATVYGEEPVAGAYRRAVRERFATITAVPSKEFLERIADALNDLASAAQAGASATLIVGVVVLIGAAAAGQRRRIYEAAVLKTLGGTRGSLILAMALRSALLGLAAGLVALAAGGLAAWAVLTYIMEATFQFDAVTAVAIVLGGVAATMITGAIFALGPLSARPARVLRARA